MKALNKKRLSDILREQSTTSSRVRTCCPPIPDDLIRKTGYECNMSYSEVQNALNNAPNIPVLHVSYGDKVCCHLCGRENWPYWSNFYAGEERKFDMEHAMLLVSTDLAQYPHRGNSMILCSDCLKREIENQFHTNTYAIYNDGTCTEMLRGFHRVHLDFENESGLKSWLLRKFERDSEIWDNNDGFGITKALVIMSSSHTLSVNGLVYDIAECSRLVCHELGITD